MKKKVQAVRDIARDTANTLLLVAVVSVIFILLILALFISGMFTPRGGVGQKSPPLISEEELPPLPVSIAKPSEDEVVSGMVPVTLINPNGRNFQKLEFWVDRQLEKKFDASAAAVSDKLYEVNYRLDTTKFADGEHILSVMAVAMDGRYQAYAVKVNFANKTALKKP